MPKNLLRITHVARILDVSEDRAYWLARQGLIPVVRIGNRQIRVDEDQLRSWIEKGGRALPRDPREEVGE